MQAWLYHGHHQKYTEDLAFWLACAAKSKGAILELGCGTGRVSLFLAEHGFTVFGIDISFDMLRTMQAIASKRLVKPLKIIQADFSGLHLGYTFPAIILPCNTYSTLSPDARKATLQRVRQHLTENGVFTVSMINPARLSTLPAIAGQEPEVFFEHPLDGNPVEVFSSWEKPDEHRITFTWTYDHLFPDGTIERRKTSVTQFIIDKETCLNEFDKAGFTKLTLFGDFQNNRYDQSSPYLIIRAAR